MKIGLARVLAATCWLACAPAHAQSVPVQLSYGQVPTPGQWSLAFSAKQDVLGYVPLNAGGGTLTGKLWLAPSASFQSGLNCGVGVAPTTPLNGDLWCTSAGLYMRANGVTVGPFQSGSSTLTANSTLTSGFTANQFLYSDGSKLQAGTFGAGLTPSGGTTALGDAGLGYSAGVMDLSTSLGLGSATSPIAVLSAPGTGEFDLAVAGVDVIDQGKTLSGALTFSMGGHAIFNIDSSDNINTLGYNYANFNINGNNNLVYNNNIALYAGNKLIICSACGEYFSNGSVSGSFDTSIARGAAGIIDIGLGGGVGDTAAYLAYAAWQAGIVYSVAGTAVPSASTLGKGARIFVSDATACVLGTTYTGSGSTACPLYSDGTNWKEGG